MYLSRFAFGLTYVGAVVICIKTHDLSRIMGLSFVI